MKADLFWAVGKKETRARSMKVVCQTGHSALLCNHTHTRTLPPNVSGVTRNPLLSRNDSRSSAFESKFNADDLCEHAFHYYH